MMWSREYCFEVTVHHILSKLCPIENSVNFSFPANSSYSLPRIKLKLCKYLHYDVKQCTLCEVTVHQLLPEYAPLKISIKFLFRANSSIHQAENYCQTMVWSSAYYFEVTVQQILTELCPFENLC